MVLVGVVLKNCFGDFCPDGKPTQGMALIRLTSLDSKPLYHAASDSNVTNGKVWEAQIIDGCWQSCELACNSEFGTPSFYEVVEFVNGQEAARHQLQFDCENNCYPNPLPISEAKHSHPCPEPEMTKYYPPVHQQGTPYPPACTCPSCVPMSQGCSGPCSPQEQGCLCALNVEDTDSVDMHLSGSGDPAAPWIVSADVKIDPSSPAPITITENGLSVACCEEHEHDAETVTSLIDNGDGTFTYVNEDGVPVTVSYCCDDVVTNLVDNGNGSFTYTNEDGVSVTVNFSEDDIVTTLVDNENGTFTYTSEDGTDTLISFNPADVNTTYVLSENNETIFLTGSDGAVQSVNICDIVENFCPETVTSLVVNDGGFTYINEDGTPTVVTFPSQGTDSLIDNGDGTYTHTSVDGVVVVIDTNTITNDLNTTYVLTEAVNDGFVTLFGSDGSESSVDICKLIDDHCPAPSEVITTLVNNGNDTFTYTSEDGTQTVISFTPQATDTNTIYDLTNIGGAVIQLSGSDGSTDQIDICSLVEGNCSDSLVDNGNGTYTHTAVNNLVTTIDVCAAVQAGGCVPSLVFNNDGTYTFNDGYGTTTVISPTDLNTTYTIVRNGDTVTLVGSDGSNSPVDICCDDVVTTLVNNFDNTYTYTNEDGVETVIAVGGGGTGTDTNTTYDLTFVGGSTISLVGSDGSTDLLDICSIVEGNCSDNLVYNGNGTYTHTAVNNSVTIIDVCAALEDGGCLPTGSDLCTDLAALNTGPCDPNAELVTTDCETIAASDLASVHGITCCTGSDINHTGQGGTGAAKSFTSVTEIDRGWPEIVGDPAGNTGLINAEETIPASGVSIDVPAATAGCTLFLQVVWSSYITQNNNSGAGSQINATDASGNVSNFSLVDHSETWVSSGTHATSQNVYIMDADTGQAGGSINLSFPNQDNPNNDPLLDGAMIWHWYEVCGVDTSCFGTPLKAGGEYTSATTVPTFGTGSIDAVDPGDCDSVAFSFMRHGSFPGTGDGPGLAPNATWPKDNNWSVADNGSYNEIVDSTSWDRDPITFFGCQVVAQGGWQPGGSGATGFDITHGITGTPDADPKVVWVPLASCEGTVGTGGTAEYSSCSNNVANPNCLVDGAIRNEVEAKVCFDLPDGAEVEVVPKLNNQPITGRAVSLTGPMKMCQVLSFSDYAQGVVGPNQSSGTQTLDFIVNVIDPGVGGDPVVDICAPSLCTEVIPV